MTKQITRIIRIEALRSGEANFNSFIVAVCKKIAGPGTGFKSLFLYRLFYPETYRSSSPDNTQYQGNDSQYDQHMDEPAYTVNEYTQ